MENQPNLKIYIGHDIRESVAYNVAENSILRNTDSSKVEVKPLYIEAFRKSGLLTREIEWRGNQMWCPISDAPVGTEFTFTRFFVPLIETGWVLFMDCDVVVKTDIREIMKYADPKYAVMVVKHDYEPKEELHMVDQIQTKYSRKNWASVMLFNCDHHANKRLTKEVINNWPGRELHALKWLQDEEIGELPPEWNYLVDVNEPMENPKIMHFTLGGPWLNGWEPKESDSHWIKAYDEYVSDIH